MSGSEVRRIKAQPGATTSASKPAICIPFVLQLNISMYNVLQNGPDDPYTRADGSTVRGFLSRGRFREPFCPHKSFVLFDGSAVRK